jgi:hypothetical protein
MVRLVLFMVFSWFLCPTRIRLLDSPMSGRQDLLEQPPQIPHHLLMPQFAAPHNRALLSDIAKDLKIAENLPATWNLKPVERGLKFRADRLADPESIEHDSGIRATSIDRSSVMEQ